jgi:hypothetical protein
MHIVQGYSDYIHVKKKLLQASRILQLLVAKHSPPLLPGKESMGDGDKSTHSNKVRAFL